MAKSNAFDYIVVHEMCHMYLDLIIQRIVI